MADGSQGFFKLCMSIFPEDYLSDSKNGIDVDSDGQEVVDIPSNRRLYSEGGNVGKKGKLTSVRRLILLCIVPQIKESYGNIELLLKLINVINIPFKFVSDFKLLIMINGQQTATSTYPYPYCFVTLANLKNRSDSSNNNNEVTNAAHISNATSSDYCIKLKTYGDVRRDYEKFCCTGKIRSMLSSVTVQLILHFSMEMMTFLFFKNAFIMV